MTIRIFTSIISNYLPKARALAWSIKKLHPDLPFHLVMAESAPASVDLKNEPFDSILLIDQLGIPNVPEWVFKHTIVEASTAVKGPALRLLLDMPETDAVIYLDPDIVVFNSLGELIELFERAAVLLTPHLTVPEKTDDAIIDNEICALQHGIYNLGFLGVKNCPEGHRFSSWWERRLIDYCYDDTSVGLFTDQRWCDFVPAFFDAVKVIRAPRYNVCTWNLTHRVVSGSLESEILVNGEPLCFYHFSGFDSGAQLGSLSKYGAGMPVLFQMREWYIAECNRRGQAELGPRPWQYSTYSNGQPISREQRLLYRHRGDLQQAFPDPFDASDVRTNKSYYAWFRAHGEPISALPNAEQQIRLLEAELAKIKSSRAWKIGRKLEKLARKPHRLLLRLKPRQNNC